MRKIRVLIVDDSVVIRRLLTDILSQDPEIEVAGTAPNGRIALAKLSAVAVTGGMVGGGAVHVAEPSAKNKGYVKQIKQATLL